METADFVVIGAGIVGLASAYAVSQKYPGKKIIVLEKEPQVATHQTGHNSGVIHTGIYYKPGSAKAKNCTHGKALLQEFCKKYGIKFETCGKIIVAVDQSELSQLELIYKRGLENGVKCSLIDSDQMKRIEPHVHGVKALHVPEAGIISYPEVAAKLVELITKNGGEVRTKSPVTEIRTLNLETAVCTQSTEICCKSLINCAGIYSDKIAKLAGVDSGVQMIPFKGEYYELNEEAKGLCKHLIYPVPDLNFPFLGVHFTRMISGKVECGPNAILAFAREGYEKWQMNIPELLETLTYPGFLKLSAKYWRRGAAEFYRSFSKAAFVRALQRLVPEIEEKMLTSAPAGIRAQAVARDGKLLDDFCIEKRQGQIHVLNAPSPAATSCLSIGESIAAMV